MLTPTYYNTLRDKKYISASKLIMIPNAADFNLSEDILSSFDRVAFRKNHDLEEYNTP